MTQLSKNINIFPRTRSPSPYKMYDFNEKTKDYCNNYKFIASNIKAAKVILVGDVSVGKTCLVNCFCRQSFNANYKATIGVDFEVELFNILGVPFHLQIWDTAGQERFKCIAQAYYRNAHVIILVFDLGDINSLNKCRNWLNDALKTSSQNPYIFLVGTKMDLLSPASYNNVEDIALNFAKELNAEFWAVSSKTKENVFPLFLRIAALSFDKLIIDEQEEQNITINSTELISMKKYKNIKPKQKMDCC